jgi:hypothetical protein
MKFFYMRYRVDLQKKNTIMSVEIRMAFAMETSDGSSG